MRLAGVFVVLIAAFAAVPSVAGAVTLDAARAKALTATQAERGRPGTILFGLQAPIRGRSSIRESGRRPPPTGTSTRVMRSVLTVGREPAYFFYLDRGAYQDYEHPGRVILVGRISGRVIRSRTLRFAPVINGRLPVFLRSREGYELPAYRVAVKDYAVAGAARAASAGPGPLGARAAATAAATPRSAASEGLVTSRLAAEKSCMVVIGGPRSFPIGSLGAQGPTPIMPLLTYNPSGGVSLSSFVATEAIGRRGCRDILIAMSGDGYRSLSPPSLRTSLSTSGSRMREYHVNSSVLRSTIAASPSVTFKLMIDGPGSGAYIEALKSLANVVAIATSSTASQTAYRYLPLKAIGGNVTRNPLRMRMDSSFFTTLLFGGAAFSASDAEVVHAANEVAAGRAPSFLAYMIARAFQLSRPFDFTADLGATQRLYTTFAVTPPGPTNRAPVATASSVTTAEDTAVAIALNASDPDSNPLTYTVGAPAHGTLTGTAPNLTYTPAPDYNGPDSFTFSVSDGSLISATVTVSITVTAVDDPPVTTASGTLAYTENDPATTIAPALTVTDVDSANLTGATVQITGNHVAAADVLALPVQPSITATFAAATGMLTLSGTASVAAYQAALRAVTYANSSDDPGNAPRTVTFKSRDAGGFGPAGTRTITITPSNDGPTDIVLSNASVAENLPLGSAVGALSDVDPDSGDSATFSLVAGAGSTDNASFQVSGSTLQTAAVFDFETKSSYSIRLRVTDGGGLTFEKQFTISVTNVNEAPTDLDLSPSMVAENQPVNTVVGALTATDPDAGDTFTFTLVGGTGSGDNGSFNVSGGSLRTSASFDFETKSSYAIRVRATDAGGLFFEKALTVTVTNVNDPPTDIALSNASVNENVPSGSLVGMLSGTDQDPLDTLTFSLVTGAGDTDNASFQVSGTMLQTAAVFDFETKSSYAIRLRVSDGNGGTFDEQFTITVTDVNDAPTNIALSPSSVTEGQPAGTTVGTLSATDQDQPANTFTFTLVAGAGSTDNAQFQISGSTLQTATVLAFNDGPTRSIRVSVSDGQGGTFEQPLTVTVNDTNVAPTDIALTPSTVAENQPVNTAVGTLSATDIDAGDTFTFSFATGAGDADNASFNIAGNSLRTSASFDFETKSSYAIRISVSDGHGGTYEEALIVTVTNANDPPTDIALSNTSVAENQAPGALVGMLSGTDPDLPLDTLTFSLVAGAGSTDNGSFQVVGTMLQTTASFDFETKSSYAIRLQVSDGNGGTFQEQFTITVTNANDAPTNILLSNAGVAENQPVATMVGTLSDVDPDAGDTAAFTLVGGVGSTDNGSFTISGTTLQTNAVFDFETKSSYSIRVRVTDGGGLFFEKQFTITVTNVNEAPTNIALSPSTVAENQPANTVVGTLSATDPDAGDTHTFTLVTGTGDDDNASFNVLGSSLRTSASFDFETKSSYSVRVRATDAGGLPFEKALTVTVTNANDAPTDIALSNASVEENKASGTAVGTLSSTDQDAGATHTYTLVAGAGAADNAKFQIAGSVLQTAQSLNFETTPTATVRIRTTDNGGLFFEEAFTITITDANDAPVATDETFNGVKRAVGNTSLVVDDPTDGAPDPAGPQKTTTGDILANDSDEDGNGTLAVVPATAQPTSDGGTVDIEADGDFTFHPAPTIGCTDHSDFFDYTVTDQNTTKPPGTAATDVGRVTIEIQDCVWYVDSSLGAAGNGTSSTPFNALTGINGAGGGGDQDSSTEKIFLYDGAYPGGLPLEASQTLSGQRHGLTVPDGGAGNVTLEPAVPGPGGAPSTITGGLTLSTNNTIQGIDLGDAPGAALSGAGVGTATMDTATPGAINNTTAGGRAVDISGGTLSMAFTAVSATGGAQGIRLDNTAGMFSAGGGTLSSATGTDVVISGNSAGDDVNFTYDGTISDDSGALVNIASQTGGTKDFNGPISDVLATPNNGGGISLQSNSASTTTRFDGGLGLSTGAAPAIAATNGGTLAITDPGGPGVGADNTVATTTGTALNLLTTTIHDDDLTFRSIASNGAPSGISLNTTANANGGLVVTGNGGSCTSAGTCTGGAIQSSTGAGVDLTNVPGGVSITRMAVTGGTDDGIRATTVAGGGMDLDSSFVANNGNAVFERGLDYTNVTGASTIASTTVTGSAESNARIANDVAGTDTLAVTGSTFSSNSTTLGAHGLEIRPDNAATVNATVTGSTLSANRDNAFVMGNSVGSPTMNLHFNSNDVLGGNPSMLSAQPGIVVAPTAGAVTKVEIDDNDVTGILGRPIIVNPLPASTAAAQLDATVTDNRIGNGTAFSGSAQAEGMMIRPAGNGDARIAIRNNVVRNFAQVGIRVLAQDANGGTANADVTMTGNTVSNPSGAGSEGIFISAGSAAGDNTILCADVGGATAALENSFVGSGTGGVQDIGFSKRFLSDIQLPGFDGIPANLTSYIQNRNVGAPTVINYDNNLSGHAGACALPTLPP